MYRGGSGAPASGTGRGQHLLKPAWMTQGLQGSQPAPSMQPSSQPHQAPHPSPTMAQGVVPGQLSSSYAPNRGYSSAQPPQSQSMYHHQPQAQTYFSAGGGSYANRGPQQQPVSLPRLPQTVIPVQTNWIEAKTPEGKTYYSNTVTGESTFDKPFDLKTPAERALPTCVWKEFCKDGRSYYVHSETKASVWEEPMEYTKFKLRLKSHCAGEMPTKDVLSMAIYQAAQKALEELVVDLDGSYAQKRAAEEAAAAADVEASKKAGLSESTQGFELVSADLQRPESKPSKASMYENKGKEIFLQMLDDWKISPTATWEEAFSVGIAADPRYRSLPTMTMRKSTVADRRAAALSSVGSTTTEELKKREEFENYITELETVRKVLGPKSTFSSLLPVFKYEKKLPKGVKESEVKAWFDARIESITKRVQHEKDHQDQALESIVHDAISRVERSEEMSAQELYERLLHNEQFIASNPQIRQDQLKRYCGTYAQRTAKKREEKLRESENQARHALRKGLLRAFSEGIVSTDSRWTEFRSDEDLRTRRAPYLVELLLPLAGQEVIVEEEFRNARGEARDAIEDVVRKLREMGFALSGVRKIADVTDATVLDELKRLEEQHGSGIVEKALSEFPRRLQKIKEKFFELLGKYVRESKDAVWEKVQPLIADRTAYKDMGSDTWKKQAFDEFVTTLDTRRSSRGRSRSRDRRRRG